MVLLKLTCFDSQFYEYRMGKINSTSLDLSKSVIYNIINQINNSVTKQHIVATFCSCSKTNSITIFYSFVLLRIRDAQDIYKNIVICLTLNAFRGYMENGNVTQWPCSPYILLC